MKGFCEFQLENSSGLFFFLVFPRDVFASENGECSVRMEIECRLRIKKGLNTKGLKQLGRMGEKLGAGCA